MNGSLIDGYAHIGLPRFQAAESLLATMDANGITHAMICPFEACPDLRETHRAFVAAPHRLRAFGLALGKDYAEIEAGMHAQLDAGFIGFRLADSRLDNGPHLLDLIGSRGGIPLVVGGNGLKTQAGRLLGFLEAYPNAIVVSPHMAGPTDEAIFDHDSRVRALFEHPNFYVVMSRQTMVDKTVLRRWTEALIVHVGWDRLLWGSEMPVLFWRDDTLAGAAEWIGAYADDEQRAAFWSGNARRAIFDRFRPQPAELVLPYEPFDHELARTAPMFPRGFEADTRLPAKLVARWMAAGGPDRETLTQFTSRLLLDAVDQ